MQKFISVIAIGALIKIISNEPVMELNYYTKDDMFSTPTVGICVFFIILVILLNLYGALNNERKNTRK